MALGFMLVFVFILLGDYKKIEMKKEITDKVMKATMFLILINMAMGLLMISDMFMDRVEYPGTISIRDNSVYVQSEHYKNVEGVAIKNENLFTDGQEIIIGETKIFQEVESIRSLDGKISQNYAFPDFYPYLGMIMAYILSGILVYVKRLESLRQEFVTLLAVITTWVLAVIGVLIMAKVFMVHILHLVDRV